MGTLLLVLAYETKTETDTSSLGKTQIDGKFDYSNTNDIQIIKNNTIFIAPNWSISSVQGQEMTLIRVSATGL